MAIILQHQHCAELQVQQHETCGWGCSCAPQQLDVACAISVCCIEMGVAGVVSRHPNNYTANGNPNAEP